MNCISDGGALDLESLLSARPITKRETRPVLLIVEICWILLFLTTTGLETHTWFLMCVEGIGTLQYIIVIALAGSDKDCDFNSQPFAPRPQLTGYQFTRDHKQFLENEK